MPDETHVETETPAEEAETEKRGLTHDELREMKKRRSVDDLHRLLVFAEETIGTPPLKTAEYDENGLTPEEAAALEAEREAEAEKKTEE